MATFTVNSDKTVTQKSIQTRIFDKAFFFSISLLFVVGGLWATQKVLLHLVDKDIAQYKASAENSLMGADTNAINQVEDFAARRSILKEVDQSVKASELLAVLEKTTIPQVKLSEYSYTEGESITVTGTTTDYRFVAEQLLRYRQEESLATMKVVSTERAEGGQLKFSFSAEITTKKAEDVNQIPTPPPTPLP